jgi:hypothetical protein
MDSFERAVALDQTNNLAMFKLACTFADLDLPEVCRAHATVSSIAMTRLSFVHCIAVCQLL